MEKHKNDFHGDILHSPDSYACPVCGGIAFIWGKTNRSDAGDLRFKMDGAGFFSWGKKIRARQCLRCGSIQFFAEVPDQY